MIVLTVVRGHKVRIHYFNSVSAAYYYYVRHYATIAEWWYYLRCAHYLLNKVSNEAVMECLFRNVFRDACIAQDRR